MDSIDTESYLEWQYQYLTEQENEKLSIKIDKYNDEINVTAEIVEAQEWIPDITNGIDYEIKEPGLAREIQQWILSTSIKRQPALAFAATIAVLSTAYGRSYSIDGVKGNVMMLCMAESGEGKDWPIKAATKILASVGMGENVYGQMASGAALVDAVSDTPNALLTIDEAGHYFSSINNKTSNQYSREIMPIITELYTSSADQYREKKRKGQESRIIKEPNLCFLGMTTERQILDSLKSTEVMDGSLARFLVIFGEKHVAINHDRIKSRNVPENITEALRSKINLFDSSPYFESTPIDVSDDYLAEKYFQDDKFNHLSIEMEKAGGDKAVFKTLYKRISVMSLQLALLLDLGESIDTYEWCMRLVWSSADVFIKKFQHLCADNENERYSKILQRVIKEAGKNGVTQSEMTRKTQSINPSLKKQLLAEFLESGLVFTNDVRVKGHQRPVKTYYWKK
jgi:hypothetical protein